MQRTAATQARYLAVSLRPRRRFDPNNFVLCRTVGTNERLGRGIAHLAGDMRSRGRKVNLERQAADQQREGRHFAAFKLGDSGEEKLRSKFDIKEVSLLRCDIGAVTSVTRRTSGSAGMPNWQIVMRSSRRLCFTKRAPIRSHDRRQGCSHGFSQRMTPYVAQEVLLVRQA
jgi:hypothetical protein